MNEYDRQYEEIDDSTLQTEWNAERRSRVKGQVWQDLKARSAEQCINAVQDYWHRMLFSSARLPGMKKLPPFGAVKINTIPTIVPLHYEFAALTLNAGKLADVESLLRYHEALYQDTGHDLTIVIDPLGDEAPLTSLAPQAVENRLVWSLPAGVHPFPDSEFHLSFRYAYAKRDIWHSQDAAGEAAFAHQVNMELRYLRAETTYLMQLGLVFTGQTFEMCRGYLDQMLAGIQYKVVDENPDKGRIDLSIDLQANRGHEASINRVIHQFQSPHQEQDMPS